MIYEPSQIALVGLIMTFGSVVQGAVGFASGLLGVPLLVLYGLSLPEAATVNLVATSVQNVTGAWRLRSHLEPRELVLPVVVRWLAIPFGTYLAWIADHHLEPAQAKQLIGAVLLVMVLVIWTCRITPRDNIRAQWQVLAFSVSGFMLGFATIGGPAMVLYVNSLTWSVAKTRGFLFFCSATGLPVAALLFWAQHGEKIVPAAISTLVVMPGILAGLWLGLCVGHHLPKRLFRQIAFGLITLIAVSAIVSPMWVG